MIDYKNYKVWQKLHELAVKVYHATHTFPNTEQFILVSTELSFILKEEFVPLLNEIKKKLYALSKPLKKHFKFVA